MRAVAGGHHAGRAVQADIDIAALAGRAAIAARREGKAHRYRDLDRDHLGNRRRHGAPANAATAADGLGEDADRIRRVVAGRAGGDNAVGDVDIDPAAIAALATRAAKRKGRGEHQRFIRAVSRAANAAAAADRLRHDTIGIGAERRCLQIVEGDIDPAAGAAVAGIAADRKLRDRQHGLADRIAARAAAAADRLRENGRGIVAGGGDGRRTAIGAGGEIAVADGNKTAIAADPAAAADANADEHAEIEHVAAIAAAAADRLGRKPIGEIAAGIDRTVFQEGLNRAGIAAFAAIAADGKQAETASARAAAAADRLRQNAGRGIARGLHGTAIVNLDEAAGPAAAAAAADNQLAAAKRAGSTPAAADRLGDDAARTIAEGRDDAGIGDRNMAAIAAKSAVAAKADDRGDRQVARAATAGDRLDQHAGRQIAACVDQAGIGRGDRAAIAALSAGAASPEHGDEIAAGASAAADRLQGNGRGIIAEGLGLRAAVGRKGDAPAIAANAAAAGLADECRIVAAIAACPADRLGEESIGRGAGRGDRRGIVDADGKRAAIAAIAAGTVAFAVLAIAAIAALAAHHDARNRLALGGDVGAAMQFDLADAGDIAAGVAGIAAVSALVAAGRLAAIAALADGHHRAGKPVDMVVGNDMDVVVDVDLDLVAGLALSALVAVVFGIPTIAALAQRVDAADAVTGAVVIVPVDVDRAIIGDGDIAARAAIAIVMAALVTLGDRGNAPAEVAAIDMGAARAERDRAIVDDGHVLGVAATAAALVTDRRILITALAGMGERIDARAAVRKRLLERDG